MKLIRVGNPDVGVKMNDAGVSDLNAGVKMKHTEVKMKEIRVANPDIEVQMNADRLGMKPIEQILADGFYFDIAPWK